MHVEIEKKPSIMDVPPRATTTAKSGLTNKLYSMFRRKSDEALSVTNTVSPSNQKLLNEKNTKKESMSRRNIIMTIVIVVIVLIIAIGAGVGTIEVQKAAASKTESTTSPTSAPTAPTKSPTTAAPTVPTNKPTTKFPTTAKPTVPTNSPTTTSPTNKPTTKSPTTTKPTVPTNSPTTTSPTNKPTTTSPTTKSPVTNKPTTSTPSRAPTTGKPTTTSPTYLQNRKIFFQPSLKNPLTGYNVDIGVNMLPLSVQTLPSHMLNSFRNIQNKIESIIVADLPSTFNYTTTLKCYGEEALRPTEDIVVDDVLILISPSSTTGFASGGPCYMTGSSQLFARVGLVSVKDTVLDNWIKNTAMTSADLRFMEDVFIHEILHILGIGTLWRKSLLPPTPEPNPNVYNGAQGLDAFRNTLGGTGDLSVDVDFGGAGTHWDECKYDDEVMTPVANSVSKLSVITCGALSDLGYTTDMSKCDAYTIPPPASCTAEGYRVTSGRMRRRRNLRGLAVSEPVIFETKAQANAKQHRHHVDLNDDLIHETSVISNNNVNIYENGKPKVLPSCFGNPSRLNCK